MKLKMKDKRILQITMPINLRTWVKFLENYNLAKLTKKKVHPRSSMTTKEPHSKNLPTEKVNGFRDKL